MRDVYGRAMLSFRDHRAVLTVVGLTAVVAAGCGGSGGNDPAQPKTCEELASVVMDSKQIGLATAGARVTATEVIAAAGSGVNALGEYCKVSAEILPVDASAPAIKLTLNLPSDWNGRGLMWGGGGYNGTILPTNGNVPVGPVDVQVPLGRGYATFSSDSGHQAGPLGSQDGTFGLNDEAVRNFSGDALKKVHDVARHLIVERYADEPRRMYFVGGSTGGREALAVAQRWPSDWDGVVSHYPAWNAASLDLQFGRITRAFAAAGAYPNQAKRRALFDASIEACDELDGVADGLVSNLQACATHFDMATATRDGKPLRCEGGEDIGDDCLSDAQISALETFSTPIVFNYTLGSGERSYPGFNLPGSDLGMAGDHPIQPTVTFLALGMQQPQTPMPAGAPYGSVFWDQWVRFFVTRDPGFDSMTLDPENPGDWLTRIQALTALQDVNSTDLSAFHARGGKLLIAHGHGDVLVATQATADYYERLVATMGQDKVHSFARYYEIPGYGHAYSTVFNAAWDSLGALEKWVEQGIEPKDLVVTDTVGVPGRTRPLCDYPAWPKYRGDGDINVAASYVCATE